MQMNYEQCRTLLAALNSKGMKHVGGHCIERKPGLKQRQNTNQQTHT